MNLDNVLLGTDLAKYKDKIKKIFFYRVCGTGMGACACLAKEAGFEVVGADSSYAPPMSTYLESMEINLYDLSEVTNEMLQEYDLIIVGNSLARQSEFARFVENSQVPFTSFPSFLGEFILKDREVIGLAGTHGKTTTTYFLSQMLENLGEDVGYFIGGIIDGREPSRLGASKYFVIEADEYDSAYFQKISKFRLYELNHMILTSLEFDHADIFNSIEDIKNEFISIIPHMGGELIANDGYKAIDDLKDSYKEINWSTYGEKSELGPLDFELASNGSQFKVKLKGRDIAFETNITGKHNVLNISSCILLLDKLGFSTVDIQNATKKLGMVKRRQEVRGKYHKLLVIDDFAHHPKAIDLTIDTIKVSYPGKKIITIFEPVSATARSSIFQKEFAESFRNSSKVVIAANSLKTTVESSKNLDCIKLVEDIKKLDVAAELATDLSSLEKIIDNYSKEESILLILSNRTCLGLWESDFVQALEKV